MRNTENIGTLGLFIRGSSFLVLLLGIFQNDIVTYGIIQQVVGIGITAIALIFRQ